MMALVGWIAWRRHDAFDTGLFLGMAAAAVVAALVRGLLFWRRRRVGMGGQRDGG
jgi:hypothetical protein